METFMVLHIMQNHEGEKKDVGSRKAKIEK
jgi:hypothetical protein